MLVETQGRRLVLSEVAARVGISQSYAHKFFPTKADLVRTLAIRWFETIEAASSSAASSNAPPAQRLEEWLLTTLRQKRDRYDANPELFEAYLGLAANHMDLVLRHTANLLKDLRAILSEMVPPDKLDEAVLTVEAATLLFRTPLTISRYRHLATDARAHAVLNILITHLKR